MKKKFLALLLAALLVVSLLPMTAFADDSFAITNGTPESAKETNHGYITIDKTTAEQGDTVTVTVNPATGYQLKSLTGVPTISTIADVLAMVEGFPEGTGNKQPPSNAWVYGDGHFTFVYNGVLIFYSRVDDNATAVPLTTTVTQGENGYTSTYSFSSSTTTLKFEMTDGKLTGIVFSSTNEGSQNKYGGTYTAPAGTTPTPAEPETITPEKQTDGTYQFTMPAYAVTVKAEFEEKAITIADILPKDFPTSSAGGWLNENGGKSYIMNDNLFVYGKNYVNLSKSVTKKDDGNYEYQGTSGTKITFVMESGKLTKINVSGSVYPENNGTYVAPHVHAFTYTANGGKLTATCTDGCDKGYDTNPLTLTLAAPASLVYDGNAKSFTFADGEADAWIGAGLELPTITYYQKYSGQGWYTTLDEAPVNAGGDYMVEIVVNSKAAQVKFTIDKATPYIKTNPEPTDIDYGEKLADSTLAGGYAQVSSTDSTEISGQFEWTNPDTAPGLDDSEVTEYDVTFTPADTNNFNTVSCKVKIKVNHTHAPVLVNGQAATEEAAGWKDYYKCDCGNLFEDANGTTPITDLAAWKAKGGNGYIPSGNEIDAAKTAAKAALDAENKKDPLKDETALTYGKKNIDNATTLADIEKAKNAAIKAIQEAQAGQHKEYKITKGNDAKIDLAKLEDTLFTSEADFSKFYEVLVDKKVVDPKHYEAKSGSTEVTLKKDYIKTLSVGEHTLTIESTDGSASTKFYIVSSPETGDKNNVILWGVLAMAMAATLIACIAGLKKRKGHN